MSTPVSRHWKTLRNVCQAARAFATIMSDKHGVHNLLASSLTCSFSANSQDGVECDLMLWALMLRAKPSALTGSRSLLGQHAGRRLATVAGDWRMYRWLHWFVTQRLVRQVLASVMWRLSAGQMDVLSKTVFSAVGHGR